MSTFACDACGGRFTKKYETHAPKAVWIGQPIFVPCPGELVEVPGDVLIDGFPDENCDRAARLDSGMMGRDERIGQTRAR